MAMGEYFLSSYLFGLFEEGAHPGALWIRMTNAFEDVEGGLRVDPGMGLVVLFQEVKDVQVAWLNM